MNRSQAIGAAAGAALVLAGGIWLGRRPAAPPPDESAGGDEARPDAAASHATGAGLLGPGARATAARPTPPAASWSSVPTDAQGRPIPPPGTAAPAEGDGAAVLRLLREARAAKDADRLRYAQALLARSLLEHPERAAQAIDALDREGDPGTLAALADVLGASPAAHTPEAAQALVRIAQTGADAPRRSAALTVLGTLAAPDAATGTAVLGIARNDPSPEMQAGALAAAGAWMGRNPALIDGLSRDVTDIARTARHDDVRGIAIQTMANLDRPLPAATLEAMGTLAQSDPVDRNRMLAAMALGSAAPGQREPVLRMFEQAYAAERSAEVRRNMLIHIVRAGRGDAPALLQRIAAADPTARQDVGDYLEILGSGETNPDRIWDAKFRRDAARGTIPGSDAEHHD